MEDTSAQQDLKSSLVWNGASVRLALVFPSTCPVGFEDAVGISPTKLPAFLELLFGGGRWRRMNQNEISNSRKWQVQEKGKVSQWWCWVRWWKRPFQGGPIWAGSGRSLPCWWSQRGLTGWREWGTGGGWPWSLRGRWGFISGAMGKQPEGCSTGQWLRGLVGSQSIKERGFWVSPTTSSPQHWSVAGSLLLALSRPPQTVPWAREVGDGHGSRLNIGHPKRPRANPWNL